MCSVPLAAALYYAPVHSAAKLEKGDHFSDFLLMNLT